MASMPISPDGSSRCAATAIRGRIGLAERDLRKANVQRLVGRGGMGQADHGAGSQAERIHDFQADGPRALRLDAHAHAAKDAVLHADAARRHASGRRPLGRKHAARQWRHSTPGLPFAD